MNTSLLMAGLLASGLVVLFALFSSKTASDREMLFWLCLAFSSGVLFCMACGGNGAAFTGILGGWLANGVWDMYAAMQETRHDD